MLAAHLPETFRGSYRDEFLLSYLRGLVGAHLALATKRGSYRKGALSILKFLVEVLSGLLQEFLVRATGFLPHQIVTALVLVILSLVGGCHLALRECRPCKEVPKARQGKVPKRVLRKMPAPNGVPRKAPKKCFGVRASRK